MTDWQPIETAPRDGARVICRCTLLGEAGYVEDRQTEVFAKWLNGRLVIDQPTGRYYSGFIPTHWLPLP